MKLLSPSFFAPSTVMVAPALLGKVIEVNGLRGRIMETEAYTQDSASHARTRTERSKLMFDTYGYVYVYLIYGMYHCLNFTTEKDGVGAVLIRAIQPLNFSARANGPGKLCKAMNITKSKHNGTAIGDKIKVFDDGFSTEKIHKTPRIGITEDTPLLWRFVMVE